MLTSDFDYELPRELIADHPAPRREDSRLMVVDRARGTIEHARFSDLPSLLNPTDLLVKNDSRVLQARLKGQRIPSGGHVELLVLERVQTAKSEGLPCDDWVAMARPAKKLDKGSNLTFADGALRAHVIDSKSDGQRIIRFETEDLHPWLEKFGEIPLPPYIIQRRKEQGMPTISPEDAKRYQTVYARDSGSVAAPTAGLHFTPEILDALRLKGVHTTSITLHVGAGTFKPVDSDVAEDHPMHSEHFTISDESAGAINAALKENHRIVAVGTTSVRTLESAFESSTGKVKAGSQDTRLYLLPGADFHVAGAMITNFHLPKSTLLMLVSAFAGAELIRQAYREAVLQKYRFYSYGDAMLLI
jgi:S-adenosylmethionine:tRNA ribosyltransferase-isomerase